MSDRSADSKSAYKPCIHCGTPFSLAVRPDSDFCCNGCAYVYKLINREGLDYYYELRDKRIDPVRSAAFQPRDYSWLETAVAKAENQSTNKEAELELDLEGISCVGCVWLIEKKFLDYPGTRSIDINPQFGQVRLSWTPGQFPARQFAQDIQKFGYLLGPAGERPQSESKHLVSKVGLTAAFALNAMLFTLPRYLGMEDEFFLANLFELLAIAFATLSLLVGGSYFILRGFRGIQNRVLHIDLPIALGISFAYIGSLVGFFFADTQFLYFDFVAIFIFLMLVGRWLQERVLESNRNRILSQGNQPKSVRIIGDDLSEESSKDLKEIEPGDRMRILPGEIVPVLAECESNEVACSLEWINGESDMRRYSINQYIPAGAQNIGIEPILLSARQSWQDSLLKRLTDNSIGSERNLFLEKVLKVYLLAILLIALGGATYWSWMANDSWTAFQVALSVLVVSCPCALGVAYPLAKEWAVLNLRQSGIFVRSSTLMNRLHNITHIVFDKTGTLTLEAPKLTNPETLKKLDPRQRSILSALVATSLHPVSRAIRNSLLESGELESIHLSEIQETVGMGIEGKNDNDVWAVGRPGWKDSQEKPSSTSECVLTRNSEVLAHFSFEDCVRDDAESSIKSLSKTFKISILSGDRQDKVRAMCKTLGLPETSGIGEQSPEAKEAWVRAQDAQSVLFVGDGANDSLAFNAAHAKGTPATPNGLLQDKADFFFTGTDLASILRIFETAEKNKKTIRSVFSFAVIYNIAVIAIALSGNMHPLLAAILMPLSSITALGLVSLRSGRRVAGNG